MQTKNQPAPMGKIISALLLLGLVFSPIGLGNLPLARAQEINKNVPPNVENNDFTSLSTVSLQDFQLLSANQGWLLFNNNLYWTGDDGANWKNISPSYVDQGIIKAVFFIDSSNGWLILVHPDDPYAFVIEQTIDGGATWQATSLDVFEPDNLNSPAAAVYMQWIDTQTGWLVIKHTTGSSFSWGSLFKSTDGGKSWAKMNLPAGEPVYFVTDKVGWVTGGGDGSKLYRTDDGGLTWQPQIIISTRSDKSILAFYQLPKFDTINDGLIPVITNDGSNKKVNFYSTENGGLSWSRIYSLQIGSNLGFGNHIPIKVIDSKRLFMIIPESNDLFRIIGQHTFQILHNEDHMAANVVKLDMADETIGWAKRISGICSSQVATNPIPGTKGISDCTIETQLIWTGNAGKNWTPISLPEIGSSSIKENVNIDRPTQASSSEVSVLSSTQTFMGQGFDSCSPPTLTQMQNWWNNSPYDVWNLYIGGSNRGCNSANQTAITTSFISQLHQQGWKFIPTWVGLQASCSTGNFNKMSSDATTAYNQGVSEANAAAVSAGNLGLSGTVIYFDLEGYDTTNTTCRNAAKSFISGWTSQLHTKGYQAGAYGSSCGSALSDFTSVPNVPDAIWLANWNYGSYNSNATVWGASCISDSYWSNHQRIRQYAGGHNETWGGTTLNIDSDVIDGIVAIPGGGGLSTWTANYYDTIDRWLDINNSSNFKCSENINGPALDKNYGSGAPCAGMDGETWVGDYNSTINFSSANYVFRVEHDDGLKLWLNNQNIADRGSSGADWICPPRPLSGNNNLRVMLREDGGDAKVKVSWTTDTSGCTPNPPLLTLNLGPNLKSRPVTIELRYLNAPIFTASRVSDANGNITDFSLTGVSPGTYNLLVKPQGWLRRQQQVTVVSGSNSVNFESSFSGSAGDIDGNNQVDILDFQVLSNEFGKAGASIRSDLNGDESVDILDFQLLSNGFGKVGYDSGIILGASAALVPANAPAGQHTLDVDTATLAMTEAWTTTGSMVSPRWYQTATLLLNGKVLVAGGYNNGALASAELYNPSTGIWTATGSMTIARFAHSATLLPNGKVLVVGGLNASWTPLASAELYDPATGLWTSVGSMGGARFGHTATMLSNSKVLVVGGTGPSGVGHLASAELYDPSTNMWTATGQISISRAGHTATRLSNGKVLVTGGLGSGSASLASVELYDAATGKWTTTGAMSNALVAHTATLLQNGKVLVVGGISNSYLSSAELYDPVLGAWTATGSLSNGRENHAATLLSDGKVLISGGWNSNLGGYLSSVELYDPGTGMWTSISPLATARSDHPTVLLSNCKMLAVGGNSASGILASAELYASANVEIFIGGTKQASYCVPSHQSMRATFTNVNMGPVKAVSTNNVPFLIAERDAWLLNGIVQSFSEMMGLPGNQVTDTYYFPWYNNVTMDTQLRFANLGNTATNITVTIAGVTQPVIPLAAGVSTRVSYAGINAGPVKVQSSGGVPMIVAERDAWLVNGVVQSFSEMMGLPGNQLTDTYYFPWYNNVTMDTQLRFANLGNSSTNITVTIAGVPQPVIPLAAGQSTRVSYATNNGPVKVQSSGGVPILVAERDAWLINGVVKSFSEMMGLPGNQLTTTYHFPWYNNVTMDTQLRFANLGNTSTNITVTIAGVAQPVITLAAGESTRISYPVNNGPVKVTSSGGVPIIVAERDAWLLNGAVRSFSEMMGLPGNQLTTTYYFPWYNNLTMDTQLRFAVP